MVTLPPLLLGATLAFWGWHTGLWWLGLPLGVLAELPRRVSWRWELGLKERQRVADLCSVLLVLAGVYLYLTQPRLGNAVILLVQWVPVLLFPLLAVQLYCGRKGVELSVLFLSLRGGRPGGDEQVDLRPAYLILCFLAAAMVPPSSQFYYPALALLAGWVLWPLASPGRSSRRRWAVALAVAIGLGYGLGLGQQRAHRGMEEFVVNWLAQWMGDSPDPFRTTTAIGEVGELKMSEHIVLRVWPDRDLTEPLLLRSASYSRYYDGTWLANPSPFEPLSLDASGWSLPGEGVANRQVSVFLSLDDGRGILPLPTGSLAIQGLQGARLSVSKHRAVKVLEGPSAALYRVRYGESGAEEDAPEETDLRVAHHLRSVLSPLAQEWGLKEVSPVDALEQLQQRFERDFTYSLRLEAPPSGRGALEHFLLHRRAGHCEYFASASVLLLRTAGIPARYARGWSVQEYSDLEDAYVARARHAHAWVLAWVDGAWRTFDPTPPDWGALEAAGRPWWGLLQDLWGRLRFLLASDEGRTENERAYLIWLLLPLVALLAWRVARRGRRRVVDRDAGKSPGRLISPFAPVDAALSRRGLGRRPGETLREWVVRLQREGEPVAIELTQAVDLYYRQRFDPNGLEELAEKRLESLLAAWMRCMP